MTPNIDDALRALAIEDERIEVPDRIEVAVMAAWESRSLDKPLTGWRYLPGLRGWWAAAATVAIILAAWVVVTLQTPRGDAPAVATTTRSPEPTPVTELVVREAPAQPPRQRRPPPQRARQDIRLVLVNDPPFAETAVTVMRVRLPRSALLNLGFPISDPDAAGDVAVEVLVGDDGIARSIRRAMPEPDDETQRQEHHD